MNYINPSIQKIIYEYVSFPPLFIGELERKTSELRRDIDNIRFRGGEYEHYSSYWGFVGDDWCFVEDSWGLNLYCCGEENDKESMIDYKLKHPHLIVRWKP